MAFQNPVAAAEKREKPAKSIDFGSFVYYTL